jgi:hypothetical protein
LSDTELDYIQETTYLVGIVEDYQDFVDDYRDSGTNDLSDYYELLDEKNDL